MNIRFLTENQYETQEAQIILGKQNITVIPIEEKIEELQTADTIKLVKDKVLKAFKKIGRPVFVEHTGLYLEYFNDLPGGLTQIFWNSLEADKFSELFGNCSNTRAIAKTIIGYCDGKNIYHFQGEIQGKISAKPKGNRDFQWDCVFIPDGFNETFSEMREAKNEISLKKKALDNFADFLCGR